MNTMAIQNLNGMFLFCYALTRCLIVLCKYNNRLPYIFDIFFSYIFTGISLTNKQFALFRDNFCPDVDPLTFPIIEEQLKKGIKTTYEWL